jgi:phage/plasmid-associated DNA primase
VTDVVEIRARHVHKDNMTFRASHSLFITTNYVPVVNETDHGTWRRLALLAFPFTFRKTTEATAGPSDRRGDARLKERLKDGHGGQHDAIVTWAVEGARRWYESGFSGLPTSVEADTRAWRKAADRILGFWDDVLVADENACVTTPDMLEAFNAWMKANGHHEWPKELFGSRFKAHAETKRHGVEERRPRNLDDLDVSRPCGAVETLPGRPYVYLGVRFRRPGEIDENIEENARRSKRSDRSGNSPYARDPEKSLDRSDRSDQGCCEGGALVLSCRLCPKSPTYWQRAAIEGLQ